MRKTEALKKKNSQASTTDTSLLTAFYLISLQIAKCKKPYSDGEELIKLSLIAACNEVLKDGYLIWQKTQKHNSLKRILKSNLFALQLDEATDIQN